MVKLRSQVLFGTTEEITKIVRQTERRYAGFGETMVGKKMQQFRPLIQKLIEEHVKEIEKLILMGVEHAKEIAESLLLIPALIPLKASLKLLPGGMDLWTSLVVYLLKKFKAKEFGAQLLTTYDRITNELIQGNKSFSQITTELRQGGQKKKK
jgi:hypothetical protein